MSWGNTTSGSAAQVKLGVKEFAVIVAANDEESKAGPVVKAAHQLQAQVGEKAVAEIVDAYPEGTTFSISVSGSASEGGVSNYVTVGYSAFPPVPEAPAA